MGPLALAMTMMRRPAIKVRAELAARMRLVAMIRLRPEPVTMQPELVGQVQPAMLLPEPAAQAQPAKRLPEPVARAQLELVVMMARVPPSQ